MAVGHTLTLALSTYRRNGSWKPNDQVVILLDHSSLGGGWGEQVGEAKENRLRFSRMLLFYTNLSVFMYQQDRSVGPEASVTLEVPL